MGEPVQKLSEEEFNDIINVPVGREAEEEVRRAWASQKAEVQYWIELIKDQNDKEDSVFVGYNGVSYLIRKATRVPVPEGVVNILRDARVETTRFVIDDNGNQRRVKETYTRFPFSQYGVASPDEVAVWKKENATTQEN